MRNLLLRLLLLLLITAGIITPSFAVYQAQDEIIWVSMAGSVLVCLILLVIAVLIHTVYSKRSVRGVLLAGSVVFYSGMLMDAMGDILHVSRPYMIIKGSLIPIGMLAITAGFFLLIKNQRRSQHDLEETKQTFEMLSITDQLSGLYNSRYFYEQLQKEIQRSQRYGRPLSILLIDIDDFKKHNDSFGHIEGDRVLRQLGRLISSVLRENDSGYRYGGEEFTIILPETDGDRAAIVAERIRSDFKSVDFSPDGQAVRKTLSAGVAEFNGNDDVSSFIKHADRAMYSAKQTGKDKVVVEC